MKKPEQQAGNIGIFLAFGAVLLLMAGGAIGGWFQIKRPVDEGQTPTPTVQAENNWRKFETETFSFQYPDGWPEAKLNQLSTRVQAEIPDTFIVEDGTFYNQDLQKDFTYE